MTAARTAGVRTRRAVLALATLALLAVLALDLDVAISGTRDTVGDLLTPLRWVQHRVSDVPPLLVVVLAAVTVLHYLAASVAARAAAGRRLPWLETFGVTFASAAANRVSLGGVGGALVLGRFLHLRARMSAASATGAVTMLALVGALSDAVVGAALVGVCLALSAPHVGSAGPELVAKLASLLPGTTVTVVAVVALVVVGMTLALLGRRRVGARAARLWREYRVSVLDLARCPGRFVALSVSSSATTLVLAAGFAAAAIMAPTSLPISDTGALMVGYLLCSAAGNAFPTPGGIGAADAAYVAVLAALGAPLGHAVTTVLVFRAVTFWLPAVIGLAAAKILRGRAAL